ncbi:MAG: ATP-binding cassette domain-containing protein [Muribaculaceae bacterium]|nr:ATP-binding cassette domain-containing protein [Muribaculaceae bacterium]
MKPFSTISPIPATPEREHGAPAIRLSEVGMRWERRDILSDVDLTVNRGDFIAITGPNGGGKTTLLRIILKLLKPTSGRVEYLTPEGEVSDKLPIGYLPQKNMIDSRFPITVEEVVASGLLSEKNVSRETLKQRVGETLGLVDLTQHARQTIGNLSGGQLQRALLGRALISNPSILILDEPLSYIDKRFEGRLYDMLKSLPLSTTILLVSHEMSVISGMATRHVIVDHTIHECTSHHHFIPSPCP